ncbi:hypothetical protein G6689_02365 [Polynucleobacter paneuropaeus]|nr:hypothetical protein G6689_02365 [Polynucleobacter paneuropaeus]
MPPPLVNAYLKDQIALIKQRALEESIKPREQVKKILLEEAIKDWVAGMVPNQRLRMYGIAEIIQLAHLKGRYKELPAKQMVATALYKCGFTQTRLWGKGLRNRRFWIYKSNGE